MDAEFARHVVLVLVGGIIGLVASIVVFLFEGNRQRRDARRTNLERLYQLSIAVKQNARYVTQSLGRRILDVAGYDVIAPREPEERGTLHSMVMVSELYHPKYLGRVLAIVDAWNSFSGTAADLMVRIQQERDARSDAERRAVANILAGERSVEDFWREDLSESEESVVNYCEILQRAIRDDMPGGG